MAIYALRMQVISRSQGRSAVAAAAYRSGEKLVDHRQGITHDYTRKQWVEHSEILLPPDPPEWLKTIDREGLWNQVEATEKRKDSQLCREMWVNLPRELSREARFAVVREFVTEAFTRHGMIADVSFHAPPCTDGGINYHAHIMLTMRPATADGFGPKERHERVPSGRVRPDGKPIYIDSRASWNSLTMHDQTRIAWEANCNRWLESAGSTARIDRRSYLERGIIGKVAEPWLGPIVFHMRELRGAMRERFSQWQYARFYRAAETRAKAAFDRLGDSPTRAGDAARMAARFHAWFDRQISNLTAEPERQREPDTRTPGMER
jgi:ATP-dependent exoDNAse (exonuclease V) alpha subunit